MAILRQLIGDPPESVLQDGRVLQFHYLGANGLADLPTQDPSLSDQKVVAAFLSAQLNDPKVSAEEISNLPAADFVATVRSYADRVFKTKIVGDMPKEAASEFLTACAEQRRIYAETVEIVRQHVLDESTRHALEVARQIQDTMAGHSPAIAASALAAMSKPWRDTVVGISAIQDIANVAAASHRLASEALSQINNAINISHASLFSRLELTGILERLAEVRGHSLRVQKGRDALDASGFGFSAVIWEDALLIELGDVSTSKNLHVPRRIVAETKSLEFQSEILTVIANVSFISHRWRVVRQALSAHRRSMYQVSVPTLISQVEGIISDLLVEEGKADRVGEKLRSRQALPKRNPKDKSRFELPGLRDKTDVLGKSADDTFGRVSEYITNELCPKRNGVLHGSNTSYGTAAESAKAVLVLAAVALLAHESANQKGQ